MGINNFHMKWEYAIVEFDSTQYDKEDVEIKLDEYGYDGWELIQILNHLNKDRFIFKRQIKMET